MFDVVLFRWQIVAAILHDQRNGNLEDSATAAMTTECCVQSMCSSEIARSSWCLKCHRLLLMLLLLLHLDYGRICAQSPQVTFECFFILIKSNRRLLGLSIMPTMFFSCCWFSCSLENSCWGSERSEILLELFVVILIFVFRCLLDCSRFRSSFHSFLFLLRD